MAGWGSLTPPAGEEGRPAEQCCCAMDVLCFERRKEEAEKKYDTWVPLTVADGCKTALYHYSRRVICRMQLHSVKPLPSATLGKELSAYPFTAKASLRVPEKHSAKIYTRQNKNAKKPKNNSKIFQNFFSGEAATSQRSPVFIEVGAFFALNSQLTRPAGFELTTSP